MIGFVPVHVVEVCLQVGGQQVKTTGFLSVVVVGVCLQIGIVHFSCSSGLACLLG